MIMPISILNFAVIVVLLFYWHNLNSNKRYIFVLYIFIVTAAALYEGSKGALFGMGLIFIISIVFKFNYLNNTFLTSNLLMFIIIIITLAFFSYIFIWVIRSYSNTQDPNMTTYLNIFYDHFIFNDDSLNFILDRFTSRLNGYDGILVARQISLDAGLSFISNDLTFLNAIKQMLGKFIPNYFGLEYSFGRIISNDIIGHSKLHNHAGAIGFYGIIRLKSILFAIISATIFFSIIGLFYRYVLYRITYDIGMQTLISSMFIFNLVSTLNSGNLDNNLFSIVLGIYHFVFFYFLIKLFKFYNNYNLK